MLSQFEEVKVRLVGLTVTYALDAVAVICVVHLVCLFDTHVFQR